MLCASAYLPSSLRHLRIEQFEGMLMSAAKPRVYLNVQVVVDPALVHYQLNFKAHPPSGPNECDSNQLFQVVHQTLASSTQLVVAGQTPKFNLTDPQQRGPQHLSRREISPTGLHQFGLPTTAPPTSGLQSLRLLGTVTPQPEQPQTAPQWQLPHRMAHIGVRHGTPEQMELHLLLARIAVSNPVQVAQGHQGSQGP